MAQFARVARAVQVVVVSSGSLATFVVRPTLPDPYCLTGNRGIGDGVGDSELFLWPFGQLSSGKVDYTIKRVMHTR